MIWGAAAIAALWLALTAAGAVMQQASPGAALMLFPRNGFAYQNAALAGSLGETGSIGDMQVGPEQLAQARAALGREPLASTALTLIGLGHGAKRGGAGDGAALMIAAHRMDKRQLVANAWLINHYGTQPGDHSREVLGLLDEALKIRPGLAMQYMPALARALSNPETIPVFQQLLRAKPAWERDFWGAVAADDLALPNGEVLRSRMLARGEAPGDTDMVLMRAFIRARRMDLALSYAKSLPVIPSDTDNLLRNGSFDQTPQMPPLDWELMSDGRIGAAVDESRGTLNINAIAGSSGTVARELVALPPESYQLLIKLGRADFTRGSDLHVRVRCAESADETIASFTEKVEGDLDRPFIVANDSRCRFYWVELIFSAIDSSGPASTSIAEVRIVRARVVQDTEAPVEKSGEPVGNSTDGNAVD